MAAGFMRLAIKEARKNLKSCDGGPFGACIVRRGQVIAVARNTVLRDEDATCHAEINAIRLASKRSRSFDLSGCAIYTTTEPCPMCFSAIHWARIGNVVFGTTISDVKKLGFNELTIPAERMRSLGGSPVKMRSSFLAPECRKLLDDWERFGQRKTY